MNANLPPNVNPDLATERMAMPLQVPSFAGRIGTSEVVGFAGPQGNYLKMRELRGTRPDGTPIYVERALTPAEDAHVRARHAAARAATIQRMDGPAGVVEHPQPERTAFGPTPTPAVAPAPRAERQRPAPEPEDVEPDAGFGGSIMVGNPSRVSPERAVEATPVSPEADEPMPDAQPAEAEPAADDESFEDHGVADIMPGIVTHGEEVPGVQHSDPRRYRNAVHEQVPTPPGGFFITGPM